MYLLVGEWPDEGVGDHLDDGLGGEHDAHLHVLLRQLLVPLQLGQVFSDVTREKEVACMFSCGVA